MTIRIAKGLELPVDVVTQAIAILARRGAGKTYTGSVLVEEVIKAKVPVVVIDPTGAWWGLRSSEDGEHPGLPVVIFGGDHGDVSLEPTAGRLIAEVVLEHPGAYVIDLSGFTSKAAEQHFAADFLEQLYRGKKRETGPLLLVVDEADVFAPQQPREKGDQLRTLGATESIVRRGRIKGLGVVLITQRAAVLNKNVLTQTEVLVVMQTTGPQDRAAIDAWIEGNGTREERDAVLASLASMERGEAWVWSPAFLRILQRVRIRRRTTFDSSRTPEAGEVAIVPKAFAQVDLEQLDERIAATREQQKANDPAALRRRIQQLESESAARLAIIDRRPEPEVRVERVEVPVLNGQVGELRELLGQMQEIGSGLMLVGTGIGQAAESISAAIGRVTATPMREQAERAPRGVPAAPARDRAVSAVATLAPAAPRRDPAPVDETGPALDRAQRALLSTLVQFPSGLTKVRLSLLSGYSHKSSSFTNALGALRTAGLVDRSGEPIRATEAGVAVLPDAPAVMSRAEALDTMRSRLGRAERAFLDAFLAYPDGLTKETLSELTGYSITSSSFTNALGRLRSLDLVDGLRVNPELLP